MNKNLLFGNLGPPGHDFQASTLVRFSPKFGSALEIFI